MRSADYEKRVKELADQVIAPARKGWVAEGFPDADTIVSGFSDDAQRLGALKVFERLLSDTVGQPLGPVAAEKFNRYRAAMQKIGPPPGSANLKLDNASDRLARSHQFQFDVLKKLAPAYAGKACAWPGKATQRTGHRRFASEAFRRLMMRTLSWKRA